MAAYQALVIGYRHPLGYVWHPFVPGISALSRQDARDGLRKHLKDSVDPFTIRYLWLLNLRGKRKLRGYKRKCRPGYISNRTRKVRHRCQ